VGSQQREGAGEQVGQGQGHPHITTMPLMLELKYEYFPFSWPGRIKLLELVFAFFCLVCSAPAFLGTQHYFILVVVVFLLGTIFFSLYYLCLAEPLNKLQVNWLMVEFWFTAFAAFLYFTAFIAMLAEFCPMESEEDKVWIDANITAGVFGMFNFIVYSAGTYLIYVEWKQPGGAAPAAPQPA